MHVAGLASGPHLGTDLDVTVHFHPDPPVGEVLLLRHLLSDGGANCCPLSRQWYVVVDLKEWAREQGVHPVTAYRWLREGKLPVPARRAGRLILVDPDPRPVPVGGVGAGYCRASPADQLDDLERQVGRVVAEATGRGLAVGKVVSEVGSGMNGHRRKLTELLSDPAVTVIVVEHPD